MNEPTPVESSQILQQQKQQKKQVKPTESQAKIQKEQQLDDPIQINQQQPQDQKFIQGNVEHAENLKKIGNDLFKNAQYFEAIQKYKQSLRYLSLEQNKKRSIIYSNISISLAKLNDNKQAISYSKKAISCDQSYIKAHLNLANLYEKIDNPEQALSSYQKILLITPNDANIRLKIGKLQRDVAQLNEKRKKQAMDGLKTLGNSFLGLFGMSLDNFKFQQGEGGGYSVSMKK